MWFVQSSLKEQNINLVKSCSEKKIAVITTTLLPRTMCILCEFVEIIFLVLTILCLRSPTFQKRACTRLASYLKHNHENTIKIINRVLKCAYSLLLVAIIRKYCVQKCQCRSRCCTEKEKF